MWQWLSANSKFTLAMLLLSAMCLAAAPCRCEGHAASDPPCCWSGHAFVPNKLERTPLRGWRSWQAVAGEVNQTFMEEAMEGLRRKRRAGASLADWGYTDVGLDAGYELKGQGAGGSCHSAAGHMLVNHSRFPSFNRMTDHAHALNLTASWYLNSDACKGEYEQRVGPTYATDAGDALAYGFDGVKFDSQAGGPSHNITLWAEALGRAAAAHGRPEGVVIENCDDKNPTYLLDDPSDCPYDHYRTGPDNSPDFFSGLFHVWRYAVPYLESASRPGCWAYPDMLGVGAPIASSSIHRSALSKGCANMTLDEERTLFANWAILSSPLVLGFDVRDDAVVQKYWHMVTNPTALRINAAWAGSAGQLLGQSAARTPGTSFDGTACEVAKPGQSIPAWLLYAKRLPGGAVAVLAINSGESALGAGDVTLSFAQLAHVAKGPAPASFAATDVWTGASQPPLLPSGKPWSAAGLAAHNSSFLLFTPH